MKTLLIGASALFLASTSAHAATILIDDFATPQGPVTDSTADGSAVTSAPMMITVGGNTISRTLMINLISTVPPEEAEAEVASGLFDLNLGTGDDAEARLIYNVDALSDDFAALGELSNLALLVEVIAADGTMKTIEAILNGTTIGVFNLPDLITTPTMLTFDLDESIAVGGTLEFVFNGSPGYDVALRVLGFEATAVPAPAALGLFGLGLAAVGFARTRRS